MVAWDGMKRDGTDGGRHAYTDVERRSQNKLSWFPTSIPVPASLPGYRLTETRLLASPSKPSGSPTRGTYHDVTGPYDPRPASRPAGFTGHMGLL